ncbi:MAG: hypothetical protein IKW45_07580 [Clostridia bacterium]|nr:hypothetical protein [Clostridia bacterium]
MKKHLEFVQEKLEKLQNKIAVKYKPYGDALYNFVQAYANKNSYLFAELSLDDNSDYIVTVQYDKFSINFIFDYSASHGYSFMEGNEIDKNDLCVGGLYIRFKFSFSDIVFSPYDIHNVLGLTDFYTLDFHEIESPDDIEKHLKILIDFIQKNLVGINNIADNEMLHKKLLDNYFADVLIADKKADLNLYETDVEEAVMLHEIRLHGHVYLQHEIDNYVRNNLTKGLWRDFCKYEKKEKLLTFEKRFLNYLFDNGCPEVDKSISESRNKSNKKNTIISLVNTISILAAVGLPYLFIFIYETIIANTVYANRVFVASNPSSVLTALLLISLVLVLPKLLRLIPYVKENVPYLFLFKDEKKINVLGRIGIVLFCIINVLFIFNIYNNVVTADINGVYYGGESLQNNEKLTFIKIQGHETYDEFDNEIFELSPDYYVVIDGDYGNYIYCEGFFYKNLNPNNTAISYVVNRGFKFETYRTIDDFHIAYDITYPND